jgi:hypothetical protein
VAGEDLEVTIIRDFDAAGSTAALPANGFLERFDNSHGLHFRPGYLPLRRRRVSNEGELLGALFCRASILALPAKA